MKVFLSFQCVEEFEKDLASILLNMLVKPSDPGFPLLGSFLLMLQFPYFFIALLIISILGSVLVNHVFLEIVHFS